MSGPTTSTPSNSSPTAGGPGASGGRPMTHRQVLEALTGILLALFVSMLSSTVVSNALPRILHDLHGSESAYTWVVTAMLLATTATTPIWGKLADLFSPRLLIQTSIVIYVVGSMFAGLSRNTGELIAFRVFQGIGAGGLTALGQVIMAAMVAPRDRGRYSGYFGGVFALATVLGPLVGGVIVDTSWLGWRWCFYVGVPVAVAAMIVLQRTLHLPRVRHQAKIDYWGASLIVAGVSLLLVWVSLAGNTYPWWSTQTALMVPGGLVLLALAAWVESRVPEPMIPLSLFRYRTVTLATIASLFIGVALFGATVFLSQYFQISKGKSPTMSGLMSLPMVGAMFLSSLATGRIITRTGYWKRFLVGGALATAVGFALLGQIRYDTGMLQLGLMMALVGAGVGATMQNLVLSVQNTVPLRDLGAGSSVVAFFRSLGGAIGVSALGAVLGSKVASQVSAGLAKLGVPANATGGAGTQIPDVHTLPAPIAHLVRVAYGQAVGEVFWMAVPFLVLAFLAVLLIREVPLRRRPGVDDAGTHQADADPREPSLEKV